jgi:hypothetical protein
VKDEYSDFAIAIVRVGLCSWDCGCCHGDVLSFELIVGVIVREGLFPPFGWHLRLFPLWERINTVHRTDRKTLIAPAAQFRDNHHIGTDIEDGSQLRRAMTKARITVDAFRHLDAHRSEFPLRISLVSLNALVSRACHLFKCR